MRKQDTEKKKLLARTLYFAGMDQSEIADKVEVSRNTVSKWCAAGGWKEERAAKTITRKEIVAKMLLQINERIESGEWTPDEICKASAAIEKLDKQTNIVTIIEVFSAYSNWLIARMKIDKELTPEMVKIMNRYQDIFIGEKLSSTSFTLSDAD